MTPLFTVYRHVAPLGAFGMMWTGSFPFAVTLERTYEDAGAPLTKIPAGQHRCRRRRYNKGGYDTWEIIIPGHSAILFHKGNKELHSDGCVLVAEQFSDMDPGVGIEPGIAQSDAGFKEFLALTNALDEFEVLFVDA